MFHEQKPNARRKAVKGGRTGCRGLRGEAGSCLPRPAADLYRSRFARGFAAPKSAARKRNTSPDSLRCRAKRMADAGTPARAAGAPGPPRRPASSRRQMLGRFAKNPAHDVEPVRSAGMRKHRLSRIFGRKICDRRGVDIRGVGQDQVEARALDRGEQIALLQRDAVLKAVLLDVARGHFERAGRDVDRLDARVGEDARGENGERTAARAEVEHRGDRLWIADDAIVLGESRHEQFANQAARDDDALVDIEGHALDVGAVDKVGGGLARGCARLDQFQESRTLAAKQPGVEKRIERVDRQAQALEDEKGGLVERRRRAVAEGEAGREKAPDRVAQPVSRGQERFNPLVDRRLRQARPPQARGSRALLALAQEMPSHLALQAPERRPFVRIRSTWRTAPPDPAWRQGERRRPQ